MRSVLPQALLCVAWLALPALAQSPPSWRAGAPGVEVKASQLSRTALLAFYQARGFSADAISPYAAACGFAFELSNSGRSTVHPRLAEWEAASAAGRVRFRLPLDWDAEWARRAVAEPARIAFRWAQFPAEPEFAPGDWIMGMAVLERRIDGPFRLIIRYRNDERTDELVLDQVTCAPLD